MTKDELIAALEVATGPSRELDWGIHEWIWGVTAPRINRMQPPTYTSSLDAALTLVPEIEAPMSPAGRWPATVDIRRQDNGTGWVSIRATDATPDEADDELCVEAGGATPAIALCIAALKARP